MGGKKKQMLALILGVTAATVASGAQLKQRITKNTDIDKLVINVKAVGGAGGGGGGGGNGGTGDGATGGPGGAGGAGGDGINLSGADIQKLVIAGEKKNRDGTEITNAAARNLRAKDNDERSGKILGGRKSAKKNKSRKESR